MVCKIGQIIRRGSSNWLVRIYVGRNPETQRRKYIGKFTHGGLRSPQALLNPMLAERDFGRNIRSPGKASACISITGLTLCPPRVARSACVTMVIYRQSRFPDEERGYSVQS